jgi:hypothetical protein
LALQNQGLAGVHRAGASATKPAVVLGSIIEEALMRRIVPLSACLFAGAVLFVAPPSMSAASAVSPAGTPQGAALLGIDDGLHLARRGGGGGFGGGRGFGGGGRAFGGGGRGFGGPRAFGGGRSFGYRGGGPGWGGPRMYRGGQVWRGRSYAWRGRPAWRGRSYAWRGRPAWRGRSYAWRGRPAWRGRSYAWRGPGWRGHWRWRGPRWGWAAPYYGYGYGGCRLVPRRVWTPYGWRRRWVRRCYW